MKIEHTNSDYVHEDGRRESLARLLDDNISKVVRDRDWRPLTTNQRRNLGVGAEVTECRLRSAGDMYFPSVWEVR